MKVWIFFSLFANTAKCFIGEPQSTNSALSDIIKKFLVTTRLDTAVAASSMSSKKGRRYFGARAASCFLTTLPEPGWLVLDALPLIPCHWCYSHSVIWGEKRWRLMAKIGHKILVGSSQTQLALFASFFPSSSSFQRNIRASKVIVPKDKLENA